MTKYCLFKINWVIIILPPNGTNHKLSAIQRGHGQITETLMGGTFNNKHIAKTILRSLQKQAQKITNIFMMKKIIYMRGC